MEGIFAETATDFQAAGLAVWGGLVFLSKSQHQKATVQTRHKQHL